MTAHEKLIHDYLSGDLSQEDEAKLFEGLSRHPEWREEMQLQLQMERAMEQDLHSVSVPPQTAGAVFASLGFRRPSKWFHHLPRQARLAQWSVRRVVFASVSGMMLFGAGYFALQANSSDLRKPAGTKDRHVTEVAAKPENSPVYSSLPRNHVFHNTNSSANANIAADPSYLNSKPAHSANNPKQKSLQSTDGLPAFPPNEPQRFYSDVGNFYSVHYLTMQKVIGVMYHGQIFLSEDSGHSWSPRPSGVTSDLYGVHFFGMTHGVAVGSQGTIVITSDAGTTWHTVESGTAATLSTVRFVTQDTAYICGDDGVMLRSTTGGASWKLLETGIHANLLRMAFRDGAIGDVYGAGGVHIATTDGGETWNTIK